jgi:hypothetical protein
VTKTHSSEDYYRACAAEMMAKAQSAPSKAIRQAYLNLALNWAQRAAASDESEEDAAPPADHPLSKKN